MFFKTHRVIQLNIEATQDTIKFFFDTFIPCNFSIFRLQLVGATTGSSDGAADFYTFAIDILKFTICNRKNYNL